ncbi:indolepyruvate ferredoxin oxidoreductase family protein [Acuticoccus mangrovi]|uniref:Indolepyruvate ferredoxin oxidoreductase family protein n=1 Tax=Acuticoccus mangrovi TaxID=2796142 RepID=A0A934ILY8_9HYPH|nr:indolepyruvate ferredoxin oxidoreductase family protein [Acuticoccus mangrovi]MBJ3774682.1 indolepyruvate ferredoxin oxidoreductase family protein [Acuticoccus mangrovi]
MTRNVSLSDKYDLDRGRVYMTGIQTLLRIAIDQRRMDEAAGLKTAGFFSGYRGSPLGGVDQELIRNKKRLDPLDIHFQPGVNEELGATAVWGTQKVGLHGKGSDYDGVFGIWYGKAPGVDRAGDVLHQATASGTARYGGALALCGDDLLAKSSILPAQSEFALQHFEMPFFNPADLQDVLDYGLHGLALSRFASNWTGILCVADTMDASGLVSVDPERLSFVFPESADPRRDHDLNRTFLLGNRLETERLLRDVRLPAVTAYVRANGLDGVAFGDERAARIGFVATGKAYRDLLQAFALLGIDEERAKALGLAVYKVAMPWPLDTETLVRFARGKEKLVAVEHKRPFLEPQIKEALYHVPEGRRPEVWGKRRPDGEHFLSDVLELRPQDLVQALMSVIPGAQEDEGMRRVAMAMVERTAWAAGHAEASQRSAYFCSGCPHSTSTKVPEGSRALPGIGCHAMTEINGNTTDGQIAMGGEGVPWVGQAPFSRDRHVFVNMGDGTYYHSGILAIRQAVAANVPITYKILYNDAVAMTGGQPHDGPLTVPMIARQLAAEGVERIVVVSERPELYEGRRDLGHGVPVHHRDELMPIERELADYEGVSAIVYDQTCAAEKRRRRKKGAYPDPDRRLFINERVCEDCGDCSVQSNCISVEPLPTPFGQKRVINQSTCNKDFSCVKGFCPSFAWVEGAAIKKVDTVTLDVEALAAALPAPTKPDIAATHNVLITGIGGFGVTTVAAVLAMAGHIDGIAASTLDMTGLAQKNGPVTSHLRFAPADTAISGPRVPTASLDTLIASDMLVACNADSLSMTASDRTLAVANTKVQPTAEFVMKRVLSFDEARMTRTLKEAARTFVPVDAAHVAEQLFGDQIFMNMMLVGVAYQAGGLPLSEEAIVEAIRLNGAAVKPNIAAFRAGRVLAADPERIRAAVGSRAKLKPMGLDERIDFLAKELAAYQDAAYADRFRAAIAALREADEARGQKGHRLTTLAVESLYKAMAYKDEYEVARLYSAPAYWDALKAEFEDPKKVRLMLAPPILSPIDPATGRPKKRAFGPWVFPLLRLIAHGKGLRGTRFDPFGRSEERRHERALVEMAFADVARACREVGSAPYGLLCELLRIPSTVKGYGPVKEANREAALKKRQVLLAQLAEDSTPPLAIAAE